MKKWVRCKYESNEQFRRDYKGKHLRWGLIKSIEAEWKANDLGIALFNSDFNIRLTKCSRHYIFYIYPEHKDHPIWWHYLVKLKEIKL